MTFILLWIDLFIFAAKDKLFHVEKSRESIKISKFLSDIREVNIL